MGDLTTLEAEIVHSIREEMVQKLSDIIFRRTDLGTGGYCDETSLQRAADIAGDEMKWSELRKQNKLNETKQSYPQFGSEGIIG